MVGRHYRGWHIALVLDENPSHTASEDYARELGIRLLWLPKRSPELNPMDELWGQAKDAVSANKQRETIDDHVNRFLAYLENLSNWEALNTSGVLSDDFWLKSYCDTTIADLLRGFDERIRRHSVQVPRLRARILL